MTKEFNRDYGVSKEELNFILQNYEYNKNDNIAYKELNISNLKDEEFKEYKNVDLALYACREELKNFLKENVINISNLGRVKINNKIEKQFQKKYGYLYVRLNDKIEYPVYRFVAEVWCKCPVSDTLIKLPKNDYWIVHHKTNNGFDNRCSNLIWMLRSDHSQLSHKNYLYQIRKNLKNNLTNISVNKDEAMGMLEDLLALNKGDEKFINDAISKYEIKNEDVSDSFWNLKKYILLK